MPTCFGAMTSYASAFRNDGSEGTSQDRKKIAHVAETLFGTSVDETRSSANARTRNSRTELADGDARRELAAQSPPLIRRRRLRGFEGTHFRVGLITFGVQAEAGTGRLTARRRSGYGARTARLSIWRRLRVQPRREYELLRAFLLRALNSVAPIQVDSQSLHFVFTSSSRAAIQNGPRSVRSRKASRTFEACFEAW